LTAHGRRLCRTGPSPVEKRTTRMLKVALVLLVALSLPGCATVSTGGGNVDRLQSDLKSCTRETFAFTFIPDLGSTREYQRAKCMKDRGWIRDYGAKGGVNKWAWVGYAARPLRAWPPGNHHHLSARPRLPVGDSGRRRGGRRVDGVVVRSVAR